MWANVHFADCIMPSLSGSRKGFTLHLIFLRLSRSTKAEGQMCRLKLTQRVDEGAMITPSGSEGAAPPDQPVQHSLQSEAPAGAIDLVCDTDGP